MPMLHCCSLSLEKPLSSEPPGSEVPLNTGRNQDLNTSLVNSTHCKRMAGEVPSPSLRFPGREGRVNGARDVLPLYGQRRNSVNSADCHAMYFHE